METSAVFVQYTDYFLQWSPESFSCETTPTKIYYDNHHYALFALKSHFKFRLNGLLIDCDDLMIIQSSLEASRPWYKFLFATFMTHRTGPLFTLSSYRKLVDVLGPLNGFLVSYLLLFYLRLDWEFLITD